MSKLNISAGTIVKTTQDNVSTAWDLPAGSIGRVIEVKDGRYLPFLVEFRSWNRGHDGMGGRGVGSRWWVMARDVTLADDEVRRSSLTPQSRKLLTILEAGRSVTRVTAMHYGIMNLTARVADLRNAGWKVECETKYDVEGNRYGEFSLAA